MISFCDFSAFEWSARRAAGSKIRVGNAIQFDCFTAKFSRVSHGSTSKCMNRTVPADQRSVHVQRELDLELLDLQMYTLILEDLKRCDLSNVSMQLLFVILES